ncbi:MAG TPA: glycosyltransferase [Sedimentisphaerales bacterium]|nr:glycosyltransferase [Sedimentisphaerales bacterium]
MAAFTPRDNRLRGEAVIHLVFVTFNRLDYTKLALASVLADPAEQFSLTIWDNASTDGTVEYLRNEVNDQRVDDIVFSEKNMGHTAAINEVWGKSKADLLGKLDNDCLVTPGWTRTLAQAHYDIPNLGVIACWHFFPEDFDYEQARHKIQTFGKHRIFRHPWTCGTGLLVKRRTFERFGPIQSRGRGTTQYWLQMARAGYINGWYYPLVFQEHMDDPRSQHSRVNRMPFERAYEHTFAYRTGFVTNMEMYKKLHEDILQNLLSGPYDPKYYCGWRAKFRRALGRINRAIKQAQ